LDGKKAGHTEDFLAFFAFLLLPVDF